MARSCRNSKVIRYIYIWVLPIIETGLKSIYEGPKTVLNSICPNFESLWLGKCIIDNCIFVFKSKPDI